MARNDTLHLSPTKQRNPSLEEKMAASITSAPLSPAGNILSENARQMPTHPNALRLECERRFFANTISTPVNNTPLVLQ
jgi:hypothetical protein